MVVYIENFKCFIKKPLELINEFSEVAGYKIKQKSVAFLRTTKELSGREFKKRIPFTIVQPC